MNDTRPVCAKARLNLALDRLQTVIDAHEQLLRILRQTQDSLRDCVDSWPPSTAGPPPGSRHAAGSSAVPDAPGAEDEVVTPERGNPRQAAAPPARQDEDAATGEGYEAGAVPQALTPREREVLELLLLGLTNRLIARRLRIAERTVKNHLHTVYAKLGVPDRTNAVAQVMRRKLVEARSTDPRDRHGPAEPTDLL